MKYYVPAALSMLLLTACGSGEKSPVAGEYQQVTKVTELNYPEMTDEQEAQMRKDLEQSASQGPGGKFCIGGEEKAQWKDAAIKMATSLGGTCETLREEGTETVLDMHVTCKRTVTGDVSIIMTGKSDENSYTSRLGFDITNPANSQNARIAMTTTAKRVGECTSTNGLVIEDSNPDKN